MNTARRSASVYVGLLAVLLLALVLSAVPITQAVSAVVVLGIQATTGALWWGWMRGNAVGPVERAGMGLALGTAGATVCGIALGQVIPGGLAWALPSALTAAGWIVQRFRIRPRSTHHSSVGLPLAPAVMALAVSGALGLAAIAVNLRKYPLDWVGSVTSYHQDMFFFEALSTSLARFGPNETIFMSGGHIRYHWFAYEWAGQFAQAIGADPFVVLTRVLPMTALAGTLLIAVFWTQRLTKSRGVWAPTLAGVLLIFGGYVGATYGTILNFDSPSQEMTTMWMLGLSVILLQVTAKSASVHRSRPRLVLLLAGVALLSGIATGGKASIGVVVIASWALVAVIATLRRDPWVWRAWAGTCVAALAGGVVYLLYVGGSAWSGGLILGGLLNKASSVQGLNPTDYRWGIALGTGILILAVMPRWAGVFWFIATPARRWKPVTIYSIGLALVGIATLLLISGSLNDVWFALAASAPLAVVSAAGVSRATLAVTTQDRWRPASPVLLGVAVGLVLSLIVMVLWSFGPETRLALRWAGPVVGAVGAVVIGLLLARNRGLHSSYRRRAIAMILLILVITATDSRLLGLRANAFGVLGDGLRPTEFAPFLPFLPTRDTTIVSSINEDQLAVAAWLQQNAPLTDIIATNMTYAPIVPALTGRRSFISALQYQGAYGPPGETAEMINREWASWHFIDAPTVDDAAVLCTAHVSWIWIDSTRTPNKDWEPYATVVLHQGDVILARLNPASCP